MGSLRRSFFVQEFCIRQPDKQNSEPFLKEYAHTV